MRNPMIRRCAVAGTFYPSWPDQLHTELARYLNPTGPTCRALGVVAPHAGIVYSGEVAGAVYSRVEAAERFIILCPNHTGVGPAASITTAGAWETPDGLVDIDAELALALLTHSRYLEVDEQAHRHEHAIEVHLPFLQQIARDFRFVPICVRGNSYELCEDLATAITCALGESSRSVLIVASSDMSHYETQQNAERLDRLAIDRMLALDPRGLYHTVTTQRLSMCGFIPATITLMACNTLGARRAELARYMTSGDVNGDYQRVVGYAGVIIQ